MESQEHTDFSKQGQTKNFLLCPVVELQTWWRGCGMQITDAASKMQILEMNRLPSVKVINTQTWRLKIHERLKIRELASEKKMLAYLLVSLAKCLAVQRGGVGAAPARRRRLLLCFL